MHCSAIKFLVCTTIFNCGRNFSLLAAESAGAIPTSLYGVVITVDFCFKKVNLIILKVDLSLQDSGPFFVSVVLPNLPNPLATGLLLAGGSVTEIVRKFGTGTLQALIFYHSYVIIQLLVGTRKR